MTNKTEAALAFCLAAGDERTFINQTDATLSYRVEFTPCGGFQVDLAPGQTVTLIGNGREITLHRQPLKSDG